jgi:hypothetical protein
MSTSRVERELAAVLHRRAEDAMNSTDTQTELLEFNAEVENQVRRDRRRWAAGGALAAAAALVAGFALWPGDRAEDRSGPASTPDQQDAETVADSFVRAYTAGDLETASSYVAAGATPWPGWRKDMRVTGVVQQQYAEIQPCETMSSSEAGTRVACPFSYYLLRSEELGLEPFEGNEFTVFVVDGKVVSGDIYQDWFNNGQSDLFEEIGAWVRANHPGDWAAMNIDGGGTPAEERRGLRLWEKRTQEYVDAQTAG